MKFSIMPPIAGIAQLVEHNLAKVGVASSSLVSRSKFKKALIERWGFFIVDFIRFLRKLLYSQLPQHLPTTLQ